MAHILIVDDDADIRDVLISVLVAETGFEVSSAASSSEALAAIELHRPDAAIVDIVMPNRSGLDLASHLTRLGIPVIIMTGEPGKQAKLVESDCPFLAKPFRIHTLKSAVQDALSDPAGQIAMIKAALHEIAKVKQA